jgi:hypothetical protein
MRSAASPGRCAAGAAGGSGRSLKDAPHDREEELVGRHRSGQVQLRHQQHTSLGIPGPGCLGQRAVDQGGLADALEACHEERAAARVQQALPKGLGQILVTQHRDDAFADRQRLVYIAEM